MNGEKKMGLPILRYFLSVQPAVIAERISQYINMNCSLFSKTIKLLKKMKKNRLNQANLGATEISVRSDIPFINRENGDICGWGL